MTHENWKEAPGFEGIYEVSDQGNVRRILKDGRLKPIRPYSCKGNPYLYISLCKGGKPKKFRLHRLVLLVWTGEPPDGQPECRHLDGDTQNNRLGNLCWGSNAENVEDKRRHGTHLNVARGEDHPKTHLTEDDVAQIRRMKDRATQEYLAKLYGVGQPTISKIQRGLTWKRPPHPTPANANIPEPHIIAAE